MGRKLIDMTGRRFGRLLVLSKATEGDSYGNGHAWWLCRCDCGREVSVSGASLRAGNTRSCGCLQSEIASARLKDLTGQRFGRLLVLERDKPHIHDKHTAWLCRCDCGEVVSVIGTSLSRGLTKSCGCLRSERTREHNERRREQRCG